MATTRFWCFCLWILLLICQTRGLTVPWKSSLPPMEGILFVPSHLLVSGTNAAVLVGAYRECPHLRLQCRWRRHWSTLLAIYWLLLLSGNVDVNPGP